MKKVIFLSIFICSILTSFCQTGADFGTRTANIRDLEDDFGADVNSASKTTWAFIVASKWAQNLWDANGVPYTDVNNSDQSHKIDYTQQYAQINISQKDFEVGKEIDWLNFSSANPTPIIIYDGNTKYNFSIAELISIVNTTYTINAPNSTDATIHSILHPSKFEVKYKDIFPNVSQFNDETLKFTVSKIITASSNNHYTILSFVTRYANTPIFTIGPHSVNSTKLDGLFINGNNSNFKYVSKMHNGYYDGNGFGLCPQAIGYPESSFRATISDMFLLNNSNNVKISSVNINGNSTNQYFEGEHLESGQDAGLQFGHNGVYFWRSKNVTLKDCRFEFMGFDGVNIYDPIHSNFNSGPSNYLLENINCNYNTRNGISIVSIDGILISKCKFTNTGKAVSSFGNIPSNQGINPYQGSFLSGYLPNNIQSKPTAGIDIEPENDNVINGIVKESEIRNNYRAEIVSDNLTDVYNPVNPNDFAKDWTFEDCLIEDENGGNDVWIRHRKFLFKNCNINTGFIGGCNATQIGDETKFEGCKFSNRTSLNTVIPNNYLINSQSVARRLTFDNCDFNIYGNNKIAFNIIPPNGVSNEEDYNIMKNCRVNYDGVFANTNLLETLYGFVFKGSNSITSYEPNGLRRIQLCNTIFEGSNDACNPSQFILDGRINLYHHQQLSNKFILGRRYSGTSLLNDGFCNIELNNSSVFQALTTNSTIPVEVQILKNSQIICNSSSSLTFSNANINHLGTIICKSGSFLKPTNSNFYATSSNKPVFYIDQNCSWGINPIYNSYFNSSNFSLNSNYFDTQYQNSINLPYNYPAKIDGGNPNISSAYSSSNNEAINLPNACTFINIPSSFSFTPKLYSLEKEANPPTGAQGDFAFQIKFKADPYFANGVFRDQNLIWFGAGSNNTKFAINLAGNGGYIFTRINNTVMYGNINGGGNYIDSKCHTVCVMRSNGELKIYVDGIFIKQQSFPYSTHSLSIPSTSPNYFYIGADNQLPYTFNGWIGDVAIWKRALTQEEICYNSHNKNYQDETDLVANWKMNEDSGTEIKDNTLLPANGNLAVTSNCNSSASWVSQLTIGDCSGVNFGHFKYQENSTNESDYLEESPIAIYPNPNTGSFNLDISKLENSATVTLLDITGKIVFKKEYSKIEVLSTQVINGGYLTKGMYTIVVRSSESVYTSKVVIQ